MLIGIYVKDMFLGTPEQFDDTFGGGIEWDLVGDNPCDVEMISTWTRPASPDHTDILIQEFPTEDARDEWFRRTNEQIDGIITQISETDWATAHVMNALIDLGMGEQVNQMVEVVDQLERRITDADAAVPKILTILGYGWDEEEGNIMVGQLK